MPTKFIHRCLNELSESLRDQMFQLRKEIFCDRLQWNIPSQDAKEIDRFDTEGTSYLLWVNEDETELLGSIRLMSTAQETLLRAVFPTTCSQWDFLDMQRPSAYVEATRLCLNYRMIQKHFGDLKTCFMFFLGGLFDVCASMNAEYLIANFDPVVERRCQSLGLQFQILGEDDSFGERSVKCGKFPISIENSQVIFQHAEVPHAA